MILSPAGVGSMASSLWAPPECDKDVDVDANVFLNEDFFLVTNAVSGEEEEEALLLITDKDKGYDRAKDKDEVTQ